MSSQLARRHGISQLAGRKVSSEPNVIKKLVRRHTCSQLYQGVCERSARKKVCVFSPSEGMRSVELFDGI